MSEIQKTASILKSSLVFFFPSYIRQLSSFLCSDQMQNEIL